MWWGFAFSNAMNIDADDFTLLGLNRAFALDRSQLDAAWKALQAQVHPDRFAAEGGTAQRLAMQWAVRVNEAHQRLKDPLKRAAYLCELGGAPVQAHSNTAMPGAFLMQQMEWREALEDADSARPAIGSHGPNGPCVVPGLRQTRLARRAHCQRLPKPRALIRPCPVPF